MEMEWKVILEFPDGHSEKATLARPFMPEENLVNVLLAKSGEAKFLNLDVLCCALMIPKNFPLPGEEHSDELVITAAGKHYQMVIPGHSRVYRPERSPEDMPLRKKRCGSYYGPLIKLNPRALRMFTCRSNTESTCLYSCSNKDDTLLYEITTRLWLVLRQTKNMQGVIVHYKHKRVERTNASPKNPLRLGMQRLKSNQEADHETN